jgi:ubiquinone/menaquinone biosynthesis C-methylase UbiE
MTEDARPGATVEQRNGTERQVAQHYARSDLETAILEALVASGKDIDRLTPDDLAPVDEFHTGGRQATVELVAQLPIAPGMHILDVGCGIGGPSRYVARERSCRVTGIDLTADYVRTAAALARRVGLAERIAYQHASALDLPFADATFDGTIMMHVGMNIADKPALFAGIRRVLKAGGTLAVYDAMRTGEGALRFPVHWAATAATSFVASPADYQAALEEAGFAIMQQRDRGDFARSFFRTVVARIAEDGGLPPLGVHILMQRDLSEKLTNVVDALEHGVIAPTEIICRAR